MREKWNPNEVGRYPLRVATVGRLLPFVISYATMGLTQLEAAHVLGCSVATIRKLITSGELTSGARYRHGQLDREQVEQLAAARWKRPGRRVEDDGLSYWLTTGQVADVIEVGRTRVDQLVRAGLLPFVSTPAGGRIYRREQIEVIANARLSRRLQHA